MLSHFVHLHGLSCFSDSSTDITGGSKRVNVLCFYVVPNISLVGAFVMAVSAEPGATGLLTPHLTLYQAVQHCKIIKIIIGLLVYWTKTIENCLAYLSLCTLMKCMLRAALDVCTLPQILHEYEQAKCLASM